ncbi:E3 ubiquitin-protein ligase [Aphelenchoides fujianensis]|nr:E3 ubiquitin-protein ligase [Aphelenchoides fujianensis]
MFTSFRPTDRRDLPPHPPVVPTRLPAALQKNRRARTPARPRDDRAADQGDQRGRLGLASKLLYDHWLLKAVECFAVREKDPWETEFDEKRINDSLFLPLAAAFCRDRNCRNAGGRARLAELTGIHSTDAIVGHGQTCGRMFRFGEPTYCCRECATDATCVLCHDCFKNSEHSKHKYKMRTSTGSGYCDCGDPEAFPVCSLHAPNDEQKAMMDKTIPKELHTHLHNVTLVALKFIVEFLCAGEDFPPAIDVCNALRKISNDKFQTVLFNDETHTYDAVIRALVVSIACDDSQAMRLASTVDREGRTVVCYGNREKCEAVKENVQRRTQRDTNRRTQRTGPLEVRVMRSALVACQQLAVRLLDWLAVQVREFPPLASIMGNVLLHECAAFCRLVFGQDAELPILIPTVDFDTDSITPPCGRHQSPAARLVLFDRRLWKAARCGYHQLLMSTVLMHFEHKRNFARLLVDQYDRIYAEFVDDDHDPKFSVISMAVQVFTVPTIARFLVRDHNAIEKIVRYQHNFVQQYVKSTPRGLQVLDFSNTEHPVTLERSLNSMTDLSYLLTSIPKRPSEWDGPLRQAYLQGATMFLRFLRDFQHMDEVKRLYTDHQLTESEWETAFTISIHMHDSLYLLIQWALVDPHVHMNLMCRCLVEIVHQTEKMVDFTDRRPVNVNGTIAFCIEYDISKEPISIHQPLWRFFAALLTAPPEIMANYVCEDTPGHPDYEAPTLLDGRSDVTWEPLPEVGKRSLRGFRTLLMEMPLRCLVLCAQNVAQLWRRNGFSLANQLNNYAASICRSEMFDRDVLMLQAVAALSDPDRFLVRCLDRFSLIRWAAFGFEDQPLSRSTSDPSTPSVPSATNEDLSRITVTLAEEFFHLLIMILTERYQPGVGQVSMNDALKRELIHALCTGPKAFSYLERYVPRSSPAYSRTGSLHDAANEVADFRRPAATSGGVFAEYRDQYNAFFAHYSKSQISQADQYQRKDRAKESREVRAMAPPVGPLLQPFFRPLTRLAECRLFCQLLRVVFERFIKGSRWASEPLLFRALFLCGIALNEQQRRDDEREEASAHQRQLPPEFLFVQNAEAEGLGGLLQRLESRIDANVFGDLLWWTTEKYKAAVKRTKGSSSSAAEPAASARAARPDKPSKGEVAAQKRQQAMERMKKLQQSFKNQHKDLLADEPPRKASLSATGDEDVAEGTSGQTEGLREGPDRLQFGRLAAAAAPGARARGRRRAGERVTILPEGSGFPVCLGAERSVAQLRAMRRVTCTLCQEDEVLHYGSNSPGIVCAAYVECTRLCRLQDDVKALREDDYRYFAPADLHWGPNVSTLRPHDALLVLPGRDRSRARQNAMTPRTLNHERNEYLCPLCRGLCNCAMPLLPVPSLLQGVETFSSNRKNPSKEFGAWVQRVGELCQVPLYSTNTGESPRELKSHSRKRSHSERSLAEYVKDRAKEPPLLESNVSTSSVPQAVSPFPSFLSLLMPGGGTPTAPTSPAAPVASSSAASSPAPTGPTETITNFLQETLSTIKSFLPNRPVAQTPLGARQLRRRPPVPGRPAAIPAGRHGFCGTTSWTCWASTRPPATSCRCISATLTAERKPLFGALNTRQMDCINCLVRLCSVVSFTAKPMALRLLTSRFLTPFVVPLASSRPVPPQIYPARTLVNSGEIRKIARNFQLLRRSTGFDSPTPSPLNPTTSSASSTAPAFARPGRPAALRLAVALLPVAAPSSTAFVEMNLLNVDMISMAIQLAMLSGWSWVRGRQFFHNLGRVEEGMPKIPDGSVEEHHCVQLALIGHLFQAFACHKPTEIDAQIGRIRLDESLDVEEAADDHDDEQLDDRLRQLFGLVRGSDVKPNVDLLRKSLRGCALEFMRSLAIFYQALTLVPPPEALKDPSLDAFESLCRYLGLPAGLWSSYVRVPNAQLNVVRPMKPRMLIDLPDDFSELINRAAKFRCPEMKVSGMTGPMTTMCLVCGEMICSNSYCCQRMFNHENVGACTFHMLHCGGNSGIFLRIRDCQLIFLTASKRGCMRPPPYVDEFGETDQGFKRGNPLHLNRELYRKYQRMWLHQGVAEEVMNQYELNYRNLQFDWINF